ncbi:hypothetical protein [Bacillus sp. JCM 19034]|nr:hypothetical protein [Bacillus sp. JCM 19034]
MFKKALGILLGLILLLCVGFIWEYTIGDSFIWNVVQSVVGLFKSN